jgi:hypothetical protein
MANNYSAKAVLINFFFILIKLVFGKTSDTVLLSFPLSFRSSNGTNIGSPVYKLLKNQNINESISEFCASNPLSLKECEYILDIAKFQRLKLDEHDKKTIAVIIGTRPDVIKLSLLVKSLRRWGSSRVFVINTGQHSDILTPIFEVFDVYPDIQLYLSTFTKDGLAGFSSVALASLDKIFQSFVPKLDMVIVQGDTSTAFVGALAGDLKYN